MTSTNIIERLHDPIVAVSSAPGSSAVGVVRLSGSGVIELAAKMVKLANDKSLLNVTGSTHLSCEISVGHDVCLPARVLVFQGPHSYTGQDSVELYVLGSPVITKLIAQRAVELGAQSALPGEYTARAFLSGRLSLADAEAVNSLIYADTDTQLRAARRVGERDFAKSLAAVREAVASVLALVEADIDFAEEPIEFITPASLIQRLAEINDQLLALSRDTVSAEQLGVVPRVLLLGPPNAGKSTLMNRLTGLNRSICSAVAGTTRDILSAPVMLPTSEVMLLDTAGLDHSVETVLARARSLTLRTAEQVDAAIIVVDVNDLPADSFFDTINGVDMPKTLVAINKCDLVTNEAAYVVAKLLEARQLGPTVLISAKAGVGLDQLRCCLAEMVQQAEVSIGDHAVVCTQRQRTAWQCAHDAIARAMHLAQHVKETIDCADLLAFELRDAADALGELLGDVTTEDMLSKIFANFCIGK